MTASNLSTGRLSAWGREIADNLDLALGLFESVYGYPPDDNEVLWADGESRAAASRLAEAAELPSALGAFYTAIAELRLPDIDHGHFIHPPERVLDDLTEYGPVRVAGHVTGIVFGSDGGGILFALDQDGRVHRSTTASWSDDFDVAGPNLIHFLEQLRRAVADFTADTKRHSASGPRAHCSPPLSHG